MNIGDVDLTNPDSFIEAVPFDYFRFLREQAPLTFSPRASDGGFWNVVRYADITAIEKGWKKTRAVRLEIEFVDLEDLQ